MIAGKEDPLSDPFADVEELDELVHQINPAMSAKEYLQADEYLPAYATMPEGTTMEDLRVQLREEAISGELPSTSDKIEMEDNSDDEDAGSDMETPEATLHTIHTFDEAIRVSHDLLYFLTTKGEEV